MAGGGNEQAGIAVEEDEIYLVLRCRAGNEQACRQLYAAHAPRVMAYLLRSGFDRTTAEDLLQETFLRVFRSLDTFKAERGRLGPWISAIARNVARRNWHRQDQANLFDPALAEEMLAGGENPGLAGEKQEELQALAGCVDALDEELGRTVRLRYVDGWTTRGIAAVLEMPESTVRLRLAEAIERIERCMKQRGFTSD